jgi:hypothetical protein
MPTHCPGLVIDELIIDFDDFKIEVDIHIELSCPTSFFGQT